MHKQQAHCLKENIGCRQAAKETVVMRDFKNHFLVIDNQPSGKQMAVYNHWTGLVD